jgi:hypothetical protein
MSLILDGSNGLSDVDGSAATPAIRGTDANTGIFFPAADTIAFSEGGSEVMRIDSAGNLGIGTTSPVDKLTVVASGSALSQIDSFETAQLRGSSVSYLRVSGGSVDTLFGSEAGGGSSFIGSYTNHPVTFRTNNTERMRIDSSGNLLVGTSTPLDFSVRLGVTNDGAGAGVGPFFAKTTRTDFFAVGAVGSNASFADHVIYNLCTRSANSAYNFMRCESSFGSGADVEFLLRGDGNGYADGTWNNNGADYAEYFESLTGQEIPVGSTVVLENNKVRLATETDNPADVIGVVRPKEPSKASMVVGNTAWNKWADKYLTDEFDRYIMEDHNVVEWTDEEGKSKSYESHNIPADVVVPENAVIKTRDENGIKFQHYKLNPAWNPAVEYVNRENREEWLIIGLVGQVKVLKGQVMGDRWKKMRDVSESVEEWFIR